MIEIDHDLKIRTFGVKMNLQYHIFCKLFNQKNIILALLLILPLSLQANSNRQFGLGHAFSIDDLPNGKLKNRLNSLPTQAKEKAMKWLHSFSFTTQDVTHLRADKTGGIFYSDTFTVSDSSSESSTVDGQPDSALTNENVFALNSKPGSTNTVYLDFNGHIITGTAWNSDSSTLTAQAYDLDGDPNTFNASELANIAEIWRRISEDFAPFDVNVTTAEPSSFGSTTGRLLITRDTDTDGKVMPAQGNGGVAYVNVWGRSNYSSYYSPALVYYNRLSGRADYVSEAASHEFGHNLSLSHDATSSSSYYGGHGSGNTSWAPLMGSGYNRNVTQWSKGEYPDANNQQDDIAILAGKLSPFADDHSDTLIAQTRLLSDAQGNISATTPKDDFYNEITDNKGTIGSSTDIDVFYFDAAIGEINLTITPAHQGRYYDGGNLDLLASLYDSAGILVASNDISDDTVTQLSHSVSNGRYYLAIQSTGSANYSDYGSQGQYFISGTIPVAADDINAPTPNPMAWANLPQANGRDSISMEAIIASDASGIVEYQFQCLSGASGCVNSSWQSGTTYTTNGLSSGSTYEYQVIARDAFLNITNPAISAQATTAQNTLPQLTADSVSLEANSAITIQVLANDSDPDGDNLIITAVTQGASGSVTYTQNNVTYQASGNAITDSFIYTVNDGYGGSASTVVNLNISAVNQLPVAVDDTITLTTKGGAVSISALLNDNDPDGDNAQLTIISVSGGTKGIASTDGSSITYQHTDTSKRKFNGSDTINYTIEDEMGGQANATVSIVFSSSDSAGGGNNGGGKGGSKGKK